MKMKPLLFIATLCVGLNTYAAKMTILVNGPGYVEYDNAIYQNTSFEIEYNPEEDMNKYFKVKCNPYIGVEFKSDGIYLENNVITNIYDTSNTTQEYECKVHTKNVCNDCSIKIDFNEIDLNEYVPITSHRGEYLSYYYEGELLVNGFNLNNFQEIGLEYDIQYTKYAKKASVLKIQGVNCSLDHFPPGAFMFDTYTVYFVVNGERYEDDICIINDVSEPIICSTGCDTYPVHVRLLSSEGPGVTILYDDQGNLISSYPGYGSCDLNIKQIKAIPNDGGKIIQFYRNYIADADILRNKLLNDNDYISGNSIVHYDFVGDFSIKYGPKEWPFVIADDKEIYYGEMPDALTWSTIDGDVTGVPEINTIATNTSRTGTYSINLEKGAITSDCVLLGGKLTIKKAPLVCKPQDITIIQGEDFPMKTYYDFRYHRESQKIDFPILYEGFKNNESEKCLFMEPQISTIESTMEPGVYDITLSGGYSHEYEFIFKTGKLTILPSPNAIPFEDEIVKNICVSNWDTDGDGLFSYAEAAEVSDIGTVFSKNKDITSFDELQYFTSLTKLSSSAFLYCTSLQSITIPDGVMTIGQNALSGCSAMTRISVKEGNEWFKAIDGVLFSKDGKILVQYPLAKASEYIVPYGTVTIGRDAFYQSKLTTISIPPTVKTLVYDAFGYCQQLTSVYLPEGVETMEAYVFDHCTNLESISIPSTVMSIGNKIFNYDKQLTEVTTYILSPFVIEDNNFEDIVYTNAILHVPAGTESLYANTEGWKKFKKINGDATGSIPDIDLTVEDVSIGNGNSADLTISINNDGSILNGFQFTLTLPDDIWITKDKAGNFVYELSDRYTNKKKMQVAINEIEYNVYNLICYSMTNETITGSDGPIITFSLSSSDDIPDNSIGSISNIFFSSTDGRSIPVEDVSFNIEKYYYTPGDVNGDRTVNVTDVMLIVNHIMGTSLPVFFAEAADVNNDSHIDVSDVMGVVNIILNGSSHLPAMARYADSDLHMTSSGNTAVLRMDNAEEYTAFQMDVQLPEGVRLLNAEMGENVKNHRVRINDLGGGLYKVIAFTLSNETFHLSGNDALLRLITDGEATDMQMTNIQFTNPAFETVTFSDVTGTTDIEEIASDSSDGTYYNLQGMPVKTPSHGVFIKNGKKNVFK